MRLDRYLSNMGLGSRSEIKKDITKGHVTVDNVVVRKVGFAIKPGINEICLSGQLIDYEPFVYIMMNKPTNVISATKDNKHKTVIDLVKETYGSREIFPVGRLDIDTVGLLLLTDDGAFNHALMAPKKHVEKTYFAKVGGLVTEKTIDVFKSGVVLEDGYTCKSSKLEILESGEISKVLLTITEGKYHQVKRMFEAIDMEVVYLKREKIGNLTLDKSLALGEFRPLTEEELKKIKP